jgi:RNA polymerase sigma-70 factor, ECF subfamily
MTPPAKLVQADLIAALPRLRRYARVLTGDLWRADDLVQETLACAWGKQHARQQEMNLRTWLFTIMRRLYQDRSMRRRRPHGSRPLVTADGPGSPRENPARATACSQTEADDMLTRISRLAADEREVLVLVAVEGLSYAEIATLLDTSVGTVLATLTRAREGVRLMTVRPSGSIDLL